MTKSLASTIQNQVNRQRARVITRKTSLDADASIDILEKHKEIRVSN